MTALFPNAGVAPNLTQNAVVPEVTSTETCPPLYHAMRCTPRFDPAAANAIISELMNAINLANPYDCTRLDNLRMAMQQLTDLCQLPNFGSAPDNDDRVAGCFDGVSSTVSVQQLAQYIIGQIQTLCQLPEVNTMADGDTLAGCIGGVPRRINLNNLRNLMGGGAISGLILQDQLFDSWRASGNWEVSQGTGGRTAFVARTFKDSMGITVANMEIATGGSAFVNVSNWSPHNVVYESGSETTNIIGGRQQEIAAVFKVGNQWYTKAGDVILFVGADDGTIRFRTPGYQQLTIWNASTF